MESRSAADKLIVALDVAELEEALHFVDVLSGEVRFFKVGLALFTRVGPRGIRRLKEEGIRLFLDLKFHDIPAVVSEAASASTAMGADMITVHSSGGEEMMRAAVTGAGREADHLGTEPPLVLGVTVLTSLQEGDLSVFGCADMVAAVGNLAFSARKSGLGGLVASAREAAVLRGIVGPDFRIVTPGIRPAGGEVSDQKRVATPAEAIRAGSDYLVVGRPIIKSNDPLQAARDIIEEMSKA